MPNRCSRVLTVGVPAESTPSGWTISRQVAAQYYRVSLLKFFLEQSCLCWLHRRFLARLQEEIVQ